MIIYNFLYLCDLNFFPLFSKYQTIWLTQIHSILIRSVAFQQVTSPYAPQHQELNRISCFDLINAHMYFPGHILAIFPTCCTGICTYFPYLIISILYFQCSTSFTY